MLTKSDYLLFLNSPMHMWASMHNKLEKTDISPFSQIKMKQGYEVEVYAKQYIETVLLPRYPDAKLIWQETYVDGEFQCRADALIYDNHDQVYDVYEIKSSTSVDSENERDLTFQTLIYEKNISVRNIHILHLNKDYVRQGDINVEALFVIKKLNDKVKELKDTVLVERQLALEVSRLNEAESIEACTIPDKCPCISLCHPSLPKYSIYDLINKNKKKMLALREMGVINLTDIPDEFKLSDKQQNQVGAFKNGQTYIDKMSLKNEFEKLTYPLYFLDYETFGSAIPLFDGYKPQQNLVFQYSLHKVDEDGSMNHFEFLSITKDDPSITLLDKLSTEIGPVGSVLVWNKTFEKGRNSEMAERYSQFKDFLENLNSRIYDLADSIRLGYFIHPDFHGSWSIKKVLPVLVSDLSYENMTISKGDEAMETWWNLIKMLSQNEETEADWIVESDDQELIDAMLKYCELDTLAMVEIWKYLNALLVVTV